MEFDFNNIDFHLNFNSNLDLGQDYHQDLDTSFDLNIDIDRYNKFDLYISLHINQHLNFFFDPELCIDPDMNLD